MSQFDNTPIMPPASEAPGPAGWLPVWMKVVTKPSEQTFVEITEHPDARSKTAFIWMVLVGTISGLVSGLLQSVLLASGLANNPFGTTQSGSSIGVGLLWVICISPFAGIFSTLTFALRIAVVQWIAKIFGGTGTYDKMTYASAAISAPASLVFMLLVPFNAVPYLNICIGLISVGVVFYIAFLQIMAVKTVNRFGWGQALGSVLLPGLAIIFVCGCIAAASFMLLAPMIGNVFSGINQSLQFAP